jgi:DNA-directed RNA polymerase subunit RPC12/RpoP
MTETTFEQVYEGVTKRTREHGHFFCLSCRANIMQQIMSYPNDAEYHAFSCPRCMTRLVVDPGMLAYRLLLSASCTKAPGEH